MTIPSSQDIISGKAQAAAHLKQSHDDYSAFVKAYVEENPQTTPEEVMGVWIGLHLAAIMVDEGTKADNLIS